MDLPVYDFDSPESNPPIEPLTQPAVGTKPKTRSHKAPQRNFSIPKTIFREYVRGVMARQNKDSDQQMYWYTEALDALQTDTEEFLTERFSEANKIRQLLKQKTLQSKHFLGESASTIP